MSTDVASDFQSLFRLATEWDAKVGLVAKLEADPYAQAPETEAAIHEIVTSDARGRMVIDILRQRANVAVLTRRVPAHR